MNLNLLPCYQIVRSNGKYFLLQWDEMEKAFVCHVETDERPEIAGNFLIFHDVKTTQPDKKLYSLWYVNEVQGYCFYDEKILFDKWQIYEGNFLCTSSSAEDKKQWFLIAPDSLQITALGQPVGHPQYKCFVNNQEGCCLHYFQRGSLQPVMVDDIWSDSAGSVFYRIRGDIYGMEKYPLPDGGSNWRFALKS